MPEPIRKIPLLDGEFFPVLIQSRSAPALEPIRYALAMLRNAGRAEPTIDAYMRAIAVAREWARSNGFTLESRMSAGVGLDLQEVESLSHALRAAQPVSSEDRALPGNVHRLSRSGKAVKPALVQGPAAMLDPQTGANRVRFVAGYLDWLARHSRAEGAHQALRGTVEGLSERAKVRAHRPAVPRKGLSAQQRDRLFAVVDPGSADNPFRNPAVRHRNLAIVCCLDETGMRRGELCGLRIPDIDFGKLAISIHRRAPDPADPRRQRPMTKTGARLVPIRPELADVLFAYLSGARRNEPAARTHAYVFVAHGGRRPGAPLSPRSVGKNFQVLRQALGFALHPHLLRHTWNDRFSAAIDRKATRGEGTAEAAEERIRNFLMGWSPHSRMAPLYTRRHVERAAEAALKGMHEGLYEGE